MPKAVPVGVSVVPLRVAMLLPVVMASVTGRPELAVAVIVDVLGAVTVVGLALMVMVCGSALTTMLAATGVAAE